MLLGGVLTSCLVMAESSDKGQEMSGLFSPVQRSAGIQQAFDQLNSQLQFNKPPVNMDDPASLKKLAQKAMEDGDTAEANRLMQMANSVEQKQQKGAEENIRRSYYAVKGTPQEEKFMKAMDEAGRGDVYRNIKKEEMAYESAGIAYDDQVSDAESQKLLRRYQAADGNEEVQQQVLEEAQQRGLTQHIQTYEEKQQDKLFKEADRAWTKEQRERQMKEKMILSAPFEMKDAKTYIEKAEKAGYGDEARQRVKLRREYNSDMQVDSKLSEADLKGSGMTYQQYLTSVNATDLPTANKAVAKLLADNAAKTTPVRKIPSAKKIESAKVMIDQFIRSGKGMLDFGINNQYDTLNVQMAATNLADLLENPTPGEPLDTRQAMMKAIQKAMGEQEALGIEKETELVSEEDATQQLQLMTVDDPNLVEVVREAEQAGYSQAQILALLSR